MTERLPESERDVFTRVGERLAEKALRPVLSGFVKAVNRALDRFGVPPHPKHPVDQDK